MVGINMPIYAKVQIDFQDRLLLAIENSLNPESETPSSDRSQTLVRIEDESLILEIYANDTTALRASLNSYLHWIEGIQKIIESIS
jgi:tRNA threonylcarbamoyladenosine modification (KEOPS) complex  Pcc1 subunit